MLKDLHTIQTNNVTWKVFIEGEGTPLLLLHGFPDTPDSFKHQLEPFKAAGYQLIIPFLPGYGESTITSKYYYVGNFPDDIKSLLQSLGHNKVFFLGHDWGAFAGLLTAAKYPDLIDKLVFAAVPGFKGVRKDLLRQVYRSRYIFQFQLAVLVDWYFKFRGYKKVDQLFYDWSPGWNQILAAEHLAGVRELLSRPGQMTNAMGYYRQAMRSGPFDKEIQQLVEIPIEVPSLSIAGVQDGCMGIQCFEGQEAGFSGEFEFFPIEEAGHFMHLECPEIFNKKVLAFLSA